MREFFVVSFTSLYKIFFFFVTPKSRNRNIYRREFILNVTLVGSILLSFFAFITSLLGLLVLPYLGKTYEGIPPVILFVLLTIFFLLYLGSRTGRSRLTAYVMLSLYFLGASYTTLRWGVDVPQALLTYTLTIVLSGILINSRFAFIMCTLTTLTLFVFGNLQEENLIQLNSVWRDKMPGLRDILIWSVTLFIISLMSWLSNREIEKSLKRAQASERALKRERDQLEEKVEERTRELQKTQLEKIIQLYRFAEVGRLTAGFMHDLVSPISLISLNLDRLSHENQQKNLEQINSVLKQAINGTRYLENFVTNARKQLQNQEIQKTFSLNNEVKNVIQVLSYKAKTNRVKIIFDSSENIKTFGNPLKFTQIVLNLLLNAIDAYQGMQKADRTIKISLKNIGDNIEFSVQDFGVGIPKNNVQKVFDPFFTTKSTQQGTGIGLFITKNILKKSFHGKITVKSNEKLGTTFTTTFPKKYPTIKRRNEAV